MSQKSGLRARAKLTIWDARGIRQAAATMPGFLESGGQRPYTGNVAKARRLEREGCWGVTWRTILDVLMDRTWQEPDRKAAA